MGREGKRKEREERKKGERDRERKEYSPNLKIIIVVHTHHVVRLEEARHRCVLSSHTTA